MKEISPGYYFFMVVLCALFFFCGYKYGDSRGYEDGFQIGYLYDCRDVIGSIYNQVNAQDKALKFTDSLIKRVNRENDSLKRKEHYQKLAQETKELLERYSSDSAKYYKVAEIYSDSLSRAVGSFPVNVIQSNGQRNLVICMSLEKFRNVAECRDDFNVRARLDEMLKKSKKRKN